jgi:hypothetical protein
MYQTVDQNTITYFPLTGPNSNSMTYTLLSDVNANMPAFLFSFPQAAPWSFWPGWGVNLHWFGAFE